MGKDSEAKDRDHGLKSDAKSVQVEVRFGDIL
jgi:hypothetical protein